jgi:pimeloyl-ACP methyl ester carboxylesterase
MGEFIIRAADAFGLGHPHVIGPDIGTAAALFAAAAHPGRLRSLVVGSGGSAVPLQLGSRLKDWVESPDLKEFNRVDPRQIVAGALTGIQRHALPDFTREDYLSSYEGDRMVESMRYVRTYPAELPVLRDLLPQIQIPVQIVAGRHDPAVPTVNAEFLHQRLPYSKLNIIDAGHFTWEDAADEYAALVTTWWGGGYAITGSSGSALIRES